MAKDKTPSDVTKMIKDHELKLVDFKFTDLPGTWQHFTTTLSDYSDDIFTDGLGFDGSSIRGWKVINASDMLVVPDPDTAWIDIFNAEPTLSLICTIVDLITSFEQRKVIFTFGRWIRCRIFGTRWRSNWRKQASLSINHITKWPPPARPRSTSASRR